MTTCDEKTCTDCKHWSPGVSINGGCGLTEDEDVKWWRLIESEKVFVRSPLNYCPDCAECPGFKDVINAK